MQTPRIIRGQPEKQFAVVRNLHSATLLHGESVVWLTTGDTPPTGFTWIPGVDVKRGDAAAALDGAGIIHAGTPGILQGDYGTCQTYGYHDQVKTTAAALAAGATINIDNLGAVVAGAAADDPSSRIGFCMKTGASNVAGCFIKAM